MKKRLGLIIAFILIFVYFLIGVSSLPYKGIIQLLIIAGIAVCLLPVLKKK